jgi:hypothetical protein
MSEDVVPAVPFITPVPSGMSPRPARGPDPDRFQKLAKRLVMENYNASRDKEKNPELTVDAFHIVTFTRTMTHWKAVIESLAANRLTWIVTYNGIKNEAYIEILKKLARVKVSLSDQE